MDSYKKDPRAPTPLFLLLLHDIASQYRSHSHASKHIDVLMFYIHQHLHRISLSRQHGDDATPHTTYLFNDNDIAPTSFALPSFLVQLASDLRSLGLCACWCSS